MHPPCLLDDSLGVRELAASSDVRVAFSYDLLVARDLLLEVLAQLGDEPRRLIHLLERSVVACF